MIDQDGFEDFGASYVDAIVECDRVIRAAQAEQLRLIRAWHLERAEQMPLGSGDAATSVIGELSLARNISPSAADTQFTTAYILARFPRLADALARGTVSEATVKAVCSEAGSTVDVDHAPWFDDALADQIDGLTPGRARMLARHLAISIDPNHAADRARRARAAQHITLCPDTDGTARLLVHGPAEQILAAHQALESWAHGLTATGDDRTTGQIMVQTLVERVTGLTHADQVDVEIGIVIDLPTLLGADDRTVELDGYGPLPSGIADDLIGTAHRRWYRRLITDPIDHSLLARDPRRRRFDRALAGWIRTRDRHRCRQPGCECRIRDIDHIQPHSLDGPTTTDNGQGLCRRSHTLKHLPGWKVTSDPDGTITWRTPTGHTYLSRRPELTRRRT